jgi:hypothetical protein
MTQEGVKRCPQCSVPIFKIDGCNHMTCPFVPLSILFA